MCRYGSGKTPGETSQIRFSPQIPYPVGRILKSYLSPFHTYINRIFPVADIKEGLTIKILNIKNQIPARNASHSDEGGSNIPFDYAQGKHIKYKIYK